MRVLKTKSKAEALTYLRLAEKEARSSTCKNARHGAVIVRGGRVIGRGFNSPPLDKKEFRTCLDEYPTPKEKVKFDRTCCVHAEWRAVMNALGNYPRSIERSRLYLVRLDEAGKIAKMDKAFCTTCSRIILDSGVGEFVTRHKKGVVLYPAGELNKLSYKFFKVQ